MKLKYFCPLCQRVEVYRNSWSIPFVSSLDENIVFPCELIHCKDNRGIIVLVEDKVKCLGCSLNPSCKFPRAELLD